MKTGISHTLAIILLWLCIPAIYAASEQPTIKEIVVEGNNLIKKETILHRLPYKVDGLFDPDLSAQAIKALYSFETFHQIVIEQEPLDNNTLRLHITVTEKPSLTDISFEGNTALSTKKLEEVINRPQLTTIDKEHAQRLARLIKKEYKENDYHHAKIKPELIVKKDDATKAALVFHIEEKTKSRIQKIKFRGNAAISSRALRARLMSKESWLFGFLSGAGKFNEEAFETDKQIIKWLYHDKGYFNAQITDMLINFAPDKSIIDITFIIDEGPIFHVSSCDVAKDKEIPHVLLQRTLKPKANDVYNESAVRDTIQALKTLYGEYGYIDADVAPQIVPDTTNNMVSLFFHVEKGNRWRLNRINITGNETTRDHVIRRQIVLEEGAILTSSALDMSKKNVEYLSYFEKEGVNWKKHRIDKDLIDLELQVKETQTRSLNMGLDYGPSQSDPNSGLKGFIATDLRNMQGKGWDMSFIIKGTKTQLSQFSFTMSDPYLLGSNISGNLDISYVSVGYDEWRWVSPSPREQTFGITGRVGIPLPTRDRRTSLLLEAGFENIHNNNTSTVDTNNLTEYALRLVGVSAAQQNRFRQLLNQKLQPGTLEWIGVGIVKDLRNHRIYPNDGYRIAFNSKISLPGLNNTFKFFKSTLSASWYTPLIGYNTLVLGLHGFGGYVESISDGVIPYRELFHLGGQNTIRGFNWGQVAPSWDHQNPLGGKKAIQLNAELIFPIMGSDTMRAHLFYDSGCSWDTPKTSLITENLSHIKNDTFHMRHTIGIGINMVQPQPFKISFGYKLDRNKKSGETAHELHIGMNTAF